MVETPDIRWFDCVQYSIERFGLQEDAEDKNRVQGNTITLKILFSEL